MASLKVSMLSPTGYGLWSSPILKMPRAVGSLKVRLDPSKMNKACTVIVRRGTELEPEQCRPR
jgi:hypothetical protein